MGGGPPASRPRRELRSARRLEAQPGPATAHGHRSLAHQSLRRPPHQWGLVAVRQLYASARSPARPRHHPLTPQPILAPLIPAPTTNFARNSPVTASSFEFRSLELQCFWALLKLQPIELRATFRRQRRAATHGHRSQASPPASRPHKHDKIRPARLHQRPCAKKFAQRTQNTPKSAFFRQQGEFFRGLDQNPLLLGELFRADGATAASQHLPTALPETDDTNAGGSLPRDETADTSASSLPHTFETADTFARTKRPFSGHFPPTKASRVSGTPRRAPAKTMTVSRTAPRLPAKASPVSRSPRATPTAQTSRGVRTRHNAGGTLAT